MGPAVVGRVKQSQGDAGLTASEEHVKMRGTARGGKVLSSFAALVSAAQWRFLPRGIRLNEKMHVKAHGLTIDIHIAYVLSCQVRRVQSCRSCYAVAAGTICFWK